MNTIFILHGGESSRKTESNSTFYKTIIDSVDSDHVKVLCVYFARPEHRWQESFYEDRQAFEEQDTIKHLEIYIAAADEFRNQIENSNVIFINGGFQGFLKQTLINLGDFEDLVKGKVVVGISAGANILSKYYYSQGANSIREGIGILPIKVFCHYSSECTKELDMLDRYKEKLPIHKIEEESFVVLKQEF